MTLLSDSVFFTRCSLHHFSNTTGIDLSSLAAYDGANITHKNSSSSSSVPVKIPSLLGKTTSSSLDANNNNNGKNKKRKVTNTAVSSANSKKKGGKVATTTAQQLASIKAISAPIAANDTRRTLAKMMLNTFNSCDVQKLRDVLATRCIEEMIAVHRYEGIQNPYGRPVTKLKGQSQILDMWQSLFKSAPDFFFNSLETRAFYDPEYRVVVACKFTWGGTRILDIKVAEQMNEEVLRQKLAHAADYPTDQQQLMEVMLKEREALRATSSAAVVEDINTTALNSSIQTETKSLFQGAGEFSIPEGASAKFYVDQTPLAKKMEMRCKGTFIVYLNEANLISKIEFVYISMAEAESNSHASATVDAAYDR